MFANTSSVFGQKMGKKRKKERSTISRLRDGEHFFLVDEVSRVVDETHEFVEGSGPVVQQHRWFLATSEAHNAGRAIGSRVNDPCLYQSAQASFRFLHREIQQFSHSFEADLGVITGHDPYVLQKKMSI